MSASSDVLIERLGAAGVASGAAEESLVARVGPGPVEPSRALAELHQFGTALEGQAVTSYELSVARPASDELRARASRLFREGSDCVRRIVELPAGDWEKAAQGDTLDLVLPAGLDLPFRLAADTLCSGQVADARLELGDLVTTPGPHGTACRAAPSVMSAGERSWSWREQLLADTFGAFVLLVRKGNGWEDVDAAMAAMRRLRELQSAQEPIYFEPLVSRGMGAGAATELAGIFHLAQMVTLVGNFLAGGDADRPSLLARLDRHSDEAEFALTRASDLFRTGPFFAVDAEGETVEGRDDDAGDGTRPERGEVDLEWHTLTKSALRLARLTKLLWAGCRELVRNSIWYQAHDLGDQAAAFVSNIASRSSSTPILELWPSQQEALAKNLLDQYRKAVLVQMPTSAGKTLLAQFVLLQNLSLRKDTTAVYVVPTRALVNQVTRTLRADFRPLGLRVEQAAASFDLDPLEDVMLSQRLDVLVTTPEKLSLLLRRDHASLASLSLAVVDEAHNLGDGERGAKLELFLLHLDEIVRMSATC